MIKNYLSQVHISRNSNDNLYLFVTINENELLRDRSESYKLFTTSELNNIFSKVVSKRFFIQDSNLKIHPLEDVGIVESFKLFNNQEQITYFITLGTSIEYPAKLMFNYSFKFRYHRFLDNKLSFVDQRNLLDSTQNIRILYNQIADYDESLVNYDYSELIRDNYLITTEEIDFRKYNDVHERVCLFSSEKNQNSVLNKIYFDSLGYSYFNNIIINKASVNIPFDNQKSLVDYFGKLVNVSGDYDYKRFLNQNSIYDVATRKVELFSSPSDVKTNNMNVSTFTEAGLFKQENISLKSDNSKDSENLFLMFVLMSEKAKDLTTDEEKADYMAFLEDSFNYPNYFFKHVLKFKLQYLSSMDPVSMFETWQDLNQNNLQNVLSLDNVLCRITLKNKEYYDKIAYEYFLLGAK